MNGSAALFPSALETHQSAALFKKKCGSVKNPNFFQRVVRAVFGDGAQGFARNLHANVAALAAVKLGNPNTLLLEIGVHRAIHRLGDVATNTALFLSKTRAMNAAALVGHSKCDVADSGHKILIG